MTIEEIRTGGPQAVCENLLATPVGGVVIANAAAESDMHVFVAGLLLGMSEIHSALALTRLCKPDG